MNEDRILEMFFEKARWQYAIEKGLFKDMNKAVMYQLTTPEARLAMYQRIKSGTYNDRVSQKLPIYQEASIVDYIRVG